VKGICIGRDELFKKCFQGQATIWRALKLESRVQLFGSKNLVPGIA
jgi:hypothetical protein